MDLLGNALYLARKQFYVFPLCGVDSRGYGICFREHCTESSGKHPMIRDWQHEATWRLDKVRWWWKKWPNANIGIVTGRNFFVLDIDPAHGGGESLDNLEMIYGRLPETFTVKTGGGGWHYYFRIDEKIQNGCNALGAGIDVRGNGGYVVGPGSTHVSGRDYLVEFSSPLAMAQAPFWLIKKIRETGSRRVSLTKHPTELPICVKEGGRNDFLFGEAIYHKIRSMSFERTLMYIGAINDEICRPPLPRTEVLTIVQSVYSGKRKPV